MKNSILIIVFLFSTFSFAQKNAKTSTIDFVQVLNNNKKEVLFYYQNNWEVLRKMALKRNYIHSYQLLKTTPTKDAPFTYMLITTYKNKSQFDKRELHFRELIKIKGKLRLLNKKKPKIFRKTIFGKDINHLEN